MMKQHTSYVFHCIGLRLALLLCASSSTGIQDSLPDFDPSALSSSSTSFSSSFTGGIFCLDPGGLRFGRRQPEFKHNNLVPRGAQLHFSCRPGYSLEGSGKMVCNSQGMWEPPDKPACRPVTCPEPHIEHGQIRASKVGSYYPGTTVQIVCNEGYHLKASYMDMMECQLGGTWIGHNGQYSLDIAVCVEQTCTAPPQLPNSEARVQGDFGWDGGYKLGSIVTYHCSNGFQIEDLRGSRLVCRNGRWQPEHYGVSLSKCVQGGCSRPLPINSGSFVPQMSNIYPYDTIVTYYCYMGYTLSGQTYTFRCLSDGRWTPFMRPEYLPACQHHQAAGCQEPVYIPHGRIAHINGSGPSVSNRYPENTVVSYACDQGYRFQDCTTDWIICKEGLWVNEPPACVELNGCGKPPNVQYAIVTRRDLSGPSPSSSSEVEVHYPLYTKVHYKCLPGFQLLGTPDLICSIGGCWTPNLPQCVVLGPPYDEWSLSRSSSPSPPPPPPRADGGGEDYAWSDTHLITVSVATAGSIMGALLLVQLLVVCQRRKCACLHHHHHHHPRNRLHPTHHHRPHARALAGSPCRLPPHHDPDRVALIAFADGVQVVLPTYEEAIRQSGPPPFESFAGVQRGRWGRGTLPSLPPNRRARLPPPTRDNSSESHSGATRQSSSSTCHSASGADSMGSTDTMTTSEVSTTVTLDTLSSTTSQPLSCRAMCGSVASFDTSSVINTEGVPLLEEAEIENSEEASDINQQAAEEEAEEEEEEEDRQPSTSG